MPGVTPTYGLPYQELGDPPHGPNLGQDLALEVETELQRIDTTIAARATWQAYQAYTPVWSASTTNPTLGNGTLVGRWAQIGDLVAVRVELTIGSTSTLGSGFYSFSLPVAAKAGSHLTAVVLDGSAANAGWAGVARIYAELAGGANMRIIVTAGNTGVTPTVPITFAATDIIQLDGTYERA